MCKRANHCDNVLYILGKSFSKFQKDLHAVYGDFCLSNGVILK